MVNGNSYKEVKMAKGNSYTEAELANGNSYTDEWLVLGASLLTKEDNNVSTEAYCYNITLYSHTGGMALGNSVLT